MSQDMTHHHFSDGHQQQELIQKSSENLAKATLDEAAQIETDKQLIKSHPLFVLLELLFEKCERATRGEEPPTSTAYDEDIQEFVRRHESSLSPLFIDNPEIDNLMIKAIQVLRIHLLELEKVNELCKDFCHRYITCLKGKMHSENLLRPDLGHFPDTTSQHGLMQGTTSQCMANAPNSNVTVNHQGEIVLQGNAMYQQPIVENNQIVHNENGIDGSTPLSQVGVASPPTQHMHNVPPQPTYHLHHQQQLPGTVDDPSGRKTKRGVLPKHATETLRSWLFSHIVHPYPTEDEKRKLATQTNLTLLQVNNWFINARRRILQPMLDASNPDAGASSSTNKSKKGKMQVSRPTDRFWPNSISTGGPDGQGNDEDSEVVDAQDSHAMAAKSQLARGVEHSSYVQEAGGSDQTRHLTAPDGYRGHSPDELDHRQGGQLHHYRHGDVAMTSCAPVALSLMNN